MKFGKFLLASRVIGWEEYYIDYKHLTRTIKDEVSPEAEPEAESLMSQDFTAEFIQQVERVNLAFDRKMAELEQRFQDMQSEEERISDARAAPPAPPLDAHRPDGAWDEGPSSSASCGGGGARGAQPRHLELRWRQRSRSASPKRSPTASVGRGVSESEKMARLTELQKEQFQLVCKELYQDCLTLKQVCDLNFTGLSKALKKYTKSMRRLAKGGGDDAAAAAGPGAVTYSANLKEQPFYIGIKRLEKVAGGIEESFAKLYTDRDMARAQRQLRHLHRLGLASTGYVGFLLGGCASALLAIAWAAVYAPAQDTCPFCTASLLSAVPVYRVLLMPLIWLWAWAGVTYVFKEFSVNYPFMLSMNPYTELGYDRCIRLASLFSLALLADFALFLAAVRTGFEPFGVPFYLYPLALVLFALIACVSPKGSFHFKSRRFFLSTLARIVVAPFGPEVRFVENYIADVLTSMTVFLRDVDYAAQFYLSGAFASPDSESLDASYWLTAPLITAIPSWFRLQQCIRRFYDAPRGATERRVHLANAFKYLLSLAATTSAAVGNYSTLDFRNISTWEPGKALWFAVLVLSTAYAYIWDLTMDWGLLERMPAPSAGAPLRAQLFPWRLREHRIYPSRTFYLWAAASNLLGRLAWAFTITPHGVFEGVPRGISTTAMAIIEILRRAQWSLLRIEYEYTSNAAHYRSVNDVPMMLNTEGYVGFAMERSGKNGSRWSLSGATVAVLNGIVTLTALMIIHYKWT